MQRLFLPGGHCVASESDISRDGNYVAIDVLHRPLIVWRRSGGYHALTMCALADLEVYRAALGGYFFPKVNHEDARIFPQMQRGVSSSDLPQGGRISVREEGIFPFRKYVSRKNGAWPAWHGEALDAWRSESTSEVKEPNADRAH